MTANECGSCGGKGTIRKTPSVCSECWGSGATSQMGTGQYSCGCGGGLTLEQAEAQAYQEPCNDCYGSGLNLTQHE